MSHDAVARARRFVQGTPIPEPSAAQRTKRGLGNGSATVTASFDASKNQAAVVGSDVISFVSGVTAERREAITNSALLAQLAAKHQVGDESKVYDWYNAYFDVLTNVGWVAQSRDFATYHEQGGDFDAHKAVLAVATTLFGAAPAALALVTSAINALSSMDTSTPWMTIFHRESQAANTAHFQVSLVDQDPDGQFFVSLMAFGLEAKATITQVLFFKARRDEATLHHYSGKVSINTAVLDGIQSDVKQKVVGHAAEYVRTLPDLS